MNALSQKKLSGFNWKMRDEPRFWCADPSEADAAGFSTVRPNYSIQTENKTRGKLDFSLEESTRSHENTHAAGAEAAAGEGWAAVLV